MGAFAAEVLPAASSPAEISPPAALPFPAATSWISPGLPLALPASTIRFHPAQAIPPKNASIKTGARKQASIQTLIRAALIETSNPSPQAESAEAGFRSFYHGGADSAPGTPDDAVRSVIRERSSNPEVRKAMLGALITLDDSQIRRRPGQRSSRTSTSSGDGKRAVIQLKLPFLKSPIFLPVPFLKVKNEEGEWANYIHIGKMVFGKAKGRLPFSTQDSNMFMSAFISYPLYAFDESALPEDRRRSALMRRLAMANINGFKHADAYNFWKERDLRGELKVAAPNNIPFGFIDRVFQFVLHDRPWKWMFGPITRLIHKPWRKWFDVLSDREANPQGPSAFAMIPNDADDTSMAVAIQRLHSREFDPGSEDPYYSNPENFRVDLKALSLLEDFRDLNRKKASYMNRWLGRDSGAFLTWLRDEEEPTFGALDKGVIPLKANVVDEVVNANAVFSMALNGMTQGEGFRAACDLIEKAALKKRWRHAGVYYPQRMIFPYAASRAFRDAGADNPAMRRAMRLLLGDVLIDHRFFGWKTGKVGAFPGGADETTSLSTALGVTFLLNVGREIAEEEGLEKAYDDSLTAGIRFLLREAMPYRVRDRGTFNSEGRPTRGLKWEDGLFFSEGPQNYTQWWSEAFSTAMVLESLSKFVRAYDRSGPAGRDLRIKVRSYAPDYRSAPEGFDFSVE
jgi:hypothetical protein